MLFDLNNVDGIPDDDGELPDEVALALNETKFVAQIFRAAANNDKVVILEYPASQGEGSPYAAKGRERHSTIADTSNMRAERNELGLEVGVLAVASAKATVVTVERPEERA